MSKDMNAVSKWASGVSRESTFQAAITASAKVLWQQGIFRVLQGRAGLCPLCSSYTEL